jgi:hypothetical protein
VSVFCAASTGSRSPTVARRSGRPDDRRAGAKAAQRVNSEWDVNISQAGVISLPVVALGPCEERVVRRIAEAALGLYQELLDLEG